MQPRKNLKGVGAGFLGMGVAFQVIALNGQLAFLGVAMTFVAIGTALLAKSKPCC